MGRLFGLISRLFDSFCFTLGHSARAAKVATNSCASKLQPNRSPGRDSPALLAMADRKRSVIGGGRASPISTVKPRQPAVSRSAGAASSDARRSHLCLDDHDREDRDRPPTERGLASQRAGLAEDMKIVKAQSEKDLNARRSHQDDVGTVERPNFRLSAPQSEVKETAESPAPLSAAPALPPAVSEEPTIFQELTSRLTHRISVMTFGAGEQQTRQSSSSSNDVEAAVPAAPPSASPAPAPSSAAFKPIETPSMVITDAPMTAAGVPRMRPGAVAAKGRTGSGLMGRKGSLLDSVMTNIRRASLLPEVSRQPSKKKAQFFEGMNPKPAKRGSTVRDLVRVGAGGGWRTTKQRASVVAQRILGKGIIEDHVEQRASAVEQRLKDVAKHIRNQTRRVTRITLLIGFVMLFTGSALLLADRLIGGAWFKERASRSSVAGSSLYYGGTVMSLPGVFALLVWIRPSHRIASLLLPMAVGSLAAAALAMQVLSLYYKGWSASKCSYVGCTADVISSWAFLLTALIVCVHNGMILLQCRLEPNLPQWKEGGMRSYESLPLRGAMRSPIASGSRAGGTRAGEETRTPGERPPLSRTLTRSRTIARLRSSRSHRSRAHGIGSYGGGKKTAAALLCMLRYEPKIVIEKVWRDIRLVLLIVSVQLTTFAIVVAVEEQNARLNFAESLVDLNATGSNASDTTIKSLEDLPPPWGPLIGRLSLVACMLLVVRSERKRRPLPRPTRW